MFVIIIQRRQIVFLTAFKTNGPVNVSSKTKLIKWNSFCPFGAELGEAISGRAELLCHYAQFVSGNLAFCPSDTQRQDAASSALPRTAHCSAAAASLAAVTAVQLLHRWKLWLCKKLQKTHPVTLQIENLSNLLQSLLWCENLLMDDYGSWIAVCMAVANQNNIPMRVANNVASTSPAEWPSDLQGCCAVLQLCPG